MADSTQTMQKQWAKVVAMAWADDGFKTRLIADPKTVLSENGITVPDKINIKITEGGTGELAFALPPKPTGFNGSVEALSERLQPDWCMLCSGSV